MENKWLFWIVAGIFFLILELATTALVSIWFVPAAVITCIVSLFLDSILWQIIIFSILSAVFMILFRSLYKNRLKNDRDTVKLEEHLIGKLAKTVERTDAHGGRVLVGDIYWRAVTEDGSLIEENTPVVISGIDNTTLIIKKEK